MALPGTIYLAHAEATTVAETAAEAPVATTETHASTEATPVAESTGGIGAIGVDGGALVFQLINFAILFFILKKVAYKPILGLLEERRKRIDESLKLADETTAAHAEAETKTAELLAKARAEAEAMTARTREEAAEMIKTAEARATARAEQIEKDASERMARAEQTLRTGLKKEMAGLVADATRVIIDEKLDDKKDAALIEKALSGASK